MVRQSPDAPRLQEGPWRRAIRRNGEESVNPAPCAACGFSLLFLPTIHVFLSFPCHGSHPCLACDCSFPCSLPCRLRSMYLVTHYGAFASPHRHFSLSTLHCHLLTPCTLSALCAPAFSLLSTSFPPWHWPTHPLFHVPPLPHPAPPQVSARGGSQVQDAKAPPSRAPAPGSLPCGPSEPTMVVPPAMVPSLASRGPRSTRRYAARWLLTYLGEGSWDRRASLGPKKMMWLPGTVCRAHV